MTSRVRGEGGGGLLAPTGISRAAVLSDDGVYRYQLWRCWAPGPAPLFVGLNPSTADAHVDDPTLRKDMGFSRRAFGAIIDGVPGYGGCWLGNLYAWRATDPAGLWDAAEHGGQDIVGPDNDEHLRGMASQAALAGAPVVAAWGDGGGRPRRDVFRSRARHVAALLAAICRQVWCLGVTQSGQPAHTLMLPYSAALLPLPELP